MNVCGQWWTDPKVVPHDPCLLLFMACIIPSLCEWDSGPASNQENMAKVMGWHPHDSVTLHQITLLVVDSHSCSPAGFIEARKLCLSFTIHPASLSPRQRFQVTALASTDLLSGTRRCSYFVCALIWLCIYRNFYCILQTLSTGCSGRVFRFLSLPYCWNWINQKWIFLKF